MNIVLPRAQRSDVERHQLPFPISLNVEDNEMAVDGDAAENGGGGIVTQLALDAEDDTQLESSARGRSLVPYVPCGMIFLRPLRFGAPVPRLWWKGLRFSERAFVFSFDPAKGSCFALEDRGHQLEPPIHDDGSDLEMSDGDDRDVPEDDPLASGLNNQMDRVFRQLLIDVLNFIPNRRHCIEPSYRSISKEEIEDATIVIFQNTRLSDIFNDVQWKIGTAEDWKTCFDHLLPPKGTKKEGTVQNYNNAAYLKLWERMLERMTDETAAAARNAMWRLFKKMEWAPNARQDRIWQTRSDDSAFQHTIGIRKGTPAPQVLMRKREPTWLTIQAKVIPIEI
ncbi:hypothetical protein EST38_g14702, partial [Candolleomyces aberdarensis]